MFDSWSGLCVVEQALLQLTGCSLSRYLDGLNKSSADPTLELVAADKGGSISGEYEKFVKLMLEPSILLFDAISLLSLETHA